MTLVGLVGGIGTKSTALFVDLLIARERVTQQKTPQFLLNCNSTINIGSTDRQYVISALQNTVESLQRGGATHIGMICNTAHMYLEDLKQLFPTLTFINMIGSVCNYVEKRFGSTCRIGLIGTKQVCSGGLFPRFLTTAKVISPPEEVVNLIDASTHGILNGKFHINIEDKEREILDVLIEQMRKMKDEQQIDVFVLACTDLTSIIKEKVYQEDLHVVDPMDILADCVLDAY
jgi:aspartate racemase